VTTTRQGTGEWVLLSYRLPGEPSTPRIALWRKLRRLGVAQISDGLVALPRGARTREQPGVGVRRGAATAASASRDTDPPAHAAALRRLRNVLRAIQRRD